MWKSVYIKGKLTLRRITTGQCMGKYWGSMKEWEICENGGCGMLFKTIKDMEKTYVLSLR